GPGRSAVRAAPGGAYCYAGLGPGVSDAIDPSVHPQAGTGAISISSSCAPGRAPRIGATLPPQRGPHPLEAPADTGPRGACRAPVARFSFFWRFLAAGGVKGRRPAWAREPMGWRWEKPAFFRPPRLRGALPPPPRATAAALPTSPGAATVAILA